MDTFTPKQLREAVESQCMRSSAADSPFQSLETGDGRLPCPVCGGVFYHRVNCPWWKPDQPYHNDSSALDYWKEKEGKCLACNAEISVEDQYCPTHAQELSEMLTDLE